MSGLNRGEIINALYEAGVIPPGYGGTENQFEAFHRFAALVAAAEREACALIAETPITGEQDDITMQAKDRIAAAIRARGNDAA